MYLDNHLDAIVINFLYDNSCDFNLLKIKGLVLQESVGETMKNGKTEELIDLDV